MVQFSSLLNGLAKNVSIKHGRKRNDGGREIADALAKEAKKSELMLSSPGTVNADGSDNFASVYSKRGRKGVNQDCVTVWEVYMIITFNYHLLIIE